MAKLPIKNNYKSAKNEYSLNGPGRFGSSMINKQGVMIVIESKKGNKFGAFFSAKIPFNNGIIESHLDGQAILFNITCEKIYQNKNKNI
jgi:hypothetical protein